MLSLEAVSKSHAGRPVLDAFSLDVDAGERFVLLGRSGCGKTTLLRLIAGFDRPDSGRVRIDGRDVTDLPAEQRPAGFIFQNHALFPHMTVYDNIAVGPRLRKTAETDIRARVGELLAQLGIASLRDAFPGRISGGESQRVALARALILRPKVLLLDEPLSALDLGLRRQLGLELAEMQKLFGITCLHVTHDQEEAMSLATRMGVMEDGRLAQTGAPEEVYDRPASAFVAGFVGESNRFSGTVVSSAAAGAAVVDVPGVGRLQCAAGQPPPAGHRALCFVRPERIVLNSGNDNANLNRLEGTLSESAFFGDHVRHRMLLDGGHALSIRARHAPGGGEATALPTGQRACAVFAAEDAWVFAEPGGNGRFA